MSGELGASWREAFLRVLRRREFADPLRQASLQGQLGAWTKILTTVAVSTCEALGWQAAAKGHALDLLPMSHYEYLGLDVMAFPNQSGRWHFPIAVMELENDRTPDRIAYSLWKVLCTRASLRIVFCYRQQETEIPALVQACCEQVIGPMTIQDRLALPGETLIATGCRGDSETFPYGFFTWWALDKNTGLFYLL